MSGVLTSGRVMSLCSLGAVGLRRFPPLASIRAWAIIIAITSILNLTTWTKLKLLFNLLALLWKPKKYMRHCCENRNNAFLYSRHVYIVSLLSNNPKVLLNKADNLKIESQLF
jgi:hypothetical protein